MKNKPVLLSLAFAMLIAFAGLMNQTERGVDTGAVLGGLLGAVVGHNKERKTAAIGALVGSRPRRCHRQPPGQAGAAKPAYFVLL